MKAENAGRCGLDASRSHPLQPPALPYPPWVQLVQILGTLLSVTGQRLGVGQLGGVAGLWLSLRGAVWHSKSGMCLSTGWGAGGGGDLHLADPPPFQAKLRTRPKFFLEGKMKF